MAAPIPSLEADNRRLQAIMLQAMRRARAELQNPPGGTAKARRFAEARAAARLRDLQADMQRMNASAQAILDRQVRAQFERGVRRADRLARDAGLVRDDAPVQGGLTGAETVRAGVLSRRYRGDVDKAFASIQNVAGRTIREARGLGFDVPKLKRILAGGAVDGVPAATLQRVRELAKQAAIGGFVEIPNARGGVTRIKPTVYGDLVYQTAMAEAANVAEVERLVARGSYYVKIIGSDSTNFCTRYKGLVCYIGPGTDPLGRYPNLSVLPRGGAPFHPRCTKRYVPFNPSTATPAQLAAGEPSDEARKTFGKSAAEAQKAVDAKPTPPPTPKPAPPPPAVKDQAKAAARELAAVGEKFRDRERPLKVRQAELVQQLEQATKQGRWNDTMPLRVELIAATRELQAISQERALLGRPLVAVETPTAITLTTKLTGARRRAVNEGVAEVAKLVDQRLLPAVAVRATTPAKGRRRSYYFRGAIHMTPKAASDVVIHEIGHLLEDLSPALHDATTRFYNRRTAGESLQSLRALSKFKIAYGRGEVARPDKWFDPYVGKDYGGRAYEIISMGLQYLWRDPAAFAETDPDFFDFLYRAMRGDFS